MNLTEPCEANSVAAKTGSCVDRRFSKAYNVD